MHTYKVQYISQIQFEDKLSEHIHRDKQVRQMISAEGIQLMKKKMIQRMKVFNLNLPVVLVMLILCSDGFLI